MASPYWQRRNAAARAKGYKNYYDYRAHGYGKEPPEAPRPRGEVLRRRRGHSGASDLMRLIQSGRIELAIVEPGQKGGDGKYRSARIVLTLDDMDERTFWLRGKALEPENANPLGRAIRDGGAVLLDSYGLLGPKTTAEGPTAHADDEPQSGWATEDEAA